MRSLRQPRLTIYEVVALTRMVCPEANIPSTTALATVNNVVGHAGVRLAGDTKGRAAVPVRGLKGIDLRVDEGEFIGVMGQSGSGKSTLLTILGGLSHPTRGSVLVDGIDSTICRESAWPTSGASTSASSFRPSTSSRTLPLSRT